MKLTLPASIVAACAFVAIGSSFIAVQGDKPDRMKEYMKQFARFTQPGEHHKLLERFVGKWDTETSMFMGGSPMASGKGTLEISWLMPGRWLEFQGSVAMMGSTVQVFTIMGYDNFKQSYVWANASSMDTALTHFEGDATQDEKSLIGYGTLDEYTTGENDKMVKYAFRFVDADKIVLEVHDLPIGETNTKVLEFTYTRSK